MVRFQNRPEAKISMPTYKKGPIYVYLHDGLCLQQEVYKCLPSRRDLSIPTFIWWHIYVFLPRYKKTFPISFDRLLHWLRLCEKRSSDGDPMKIFNWIMCSSLVSKIKEMEEPFTFLVSLMLCVPPIGLVRTNFAVVVCQCDQIWRYYATLAIVKSLRLLRQCLFRNVYTFLAYFGNF